MRKVVLWLAPVLVLPLGAGCDEGFVADPIEGTGVIYSLARTDRVGYPSAFSLLPGQASAIVVEQPNSSGAWDIALTEEDGRFVLLPAGALPGQGRSAIARVTGRTFEEVTEAPEDSTAYTTDTSVPLDTDAVYIVRSRQRSVCVYFSKVEPIALDPEVGSLEFRYLLNPNCNTRGLAPAEDG